VGTVARLVPPPLTGGMPGLAIAFARYRTAERADTARPSALTDARKPETSEGSLHPPNGPAVLVVDHDEAATTFYARLLGGEGYAVNVARDGPSALSAIAQHPPDVVLLDVMIPGLDGFEICRRLKRDPATRLTPVILVGALNTNTKQLRLDALEAG